MGNKQYLPIEIDINKELKKQKVNIKEDEENKNELLQICLPHFYKKEALFPS